LDVFLYTTEKLKPFNNNEIYILNKLFIGNLCLRNLTLKYIVNRAI
jgi:hypothetical protein